MSAESQPPKPQPEELAATRNIEGTFGPAELMQYPADEHGVTQLAELYTEPGTHIAWQPVDKAGETQGRQAVIVDNQNRLLFLDEQDLYDISGMVENPTRESRNLSAAYTDESPMPNLTIGESANLFGKDRVIKSVLLNIGKFSSDQLHDMGDELAGKTTNQHENPFEALDKTLDEVQRRKHTERRRKRDEEAAEKDEAEQLRKEEERRRRKEAHEQQQAELTSVRLAREKVQLAQAQADQDRRAQKKPMPLYFGASGLDPDMPFHTQHTWSLSDHRGGQTTNLVSGSALDKFDALPTAKSESGVEISPRPRLHTQGPNAYRIGGLTKDEEKTVYDRAFDAAILKGVPRENAAEAARLEVEQWQVDNVREAIYDKNIKEGKTEKEAVAAATQSMADYQRLLEELRISAADEKRVKPYVPPQPGDGVKGLVDVLEHPRHAIMGIMPWNWRRRH